MGDLGGWPELSYAKHHQEIYYFKDSDWWKQGLFYLNPKENYACLKFDDG